MLIAVIFIHCLQLGSRSSHCILPIYLWCMCWVKVSVCVCLCVWTSSSSQSVSQSCIGNPSSGEGLWASRWSKVTTWFPWTPTVWVTRTSSSDWDHRSTGARFVRLRRLVCSGGCSWWCCYQVFLWIMCVCVCVCADCAKDLESTVEGAVWSTSVWGDRRGVGDHCVGQRHREERRFHRTVSLWNLKHILSFSQYVFTLSSISLISGRRLTSCPSFSHHWTLNLCVCCPAASWTSPLWLKSKPITWSCRWRSPGATWCCWSRWPPRPTSPSPTCPSRRWTTRRSAER